MDNRSVPKMTPGRAALVGLMGCYLRCPAFLENAPEMHVRFERVSALIEG